TYRLEGLSQEDLTKLGFLQARNALEDQDNAKSGTQIKVELFTVDGDDESAPVTAFITVNSRAQVSTTGNDSLIWSEVSIDGRSGEDTVRLRHGESLDGAELAAKLRNIET